jgi:uncharacterized protein
VRSILLFILALVAIWWVRRALNRARGGDKHADGGRRRALDEPERMVGCDHCGVHVPESEGVRDGEAFFCCDEHRRLGARR